MMTHRVLTSVLLLGWLASCSSPSGLAAIDPVVCEGGGIGVARTLTLDSESAPLERLLQRGEVVLTFDDGPHPRRTPAILDALAAECTEAAFFLRGDKAADYPALVRQIAERGHAIGGHGWAHANLTELDLEDAAVDIDRGQRAIEAAFLPSSAEVPIDLFRFPFVARTRELSALLVEKNLIDITVTTDGADWTDISAADSVDRILAGLNKQGDRGIIVLHDPFAGSLEKTQLLLTRLKDEGYRIVALAN